MKGHGIGEYVQKNAPASCQVNVVGEEGKKIKKGEAPSQPEIAKQSNRNLFEWMCFSPKFHGEVGRK